MFRLVFFKILFFLRVHLLFKKKNRLIVLCFHRVSDENSTGYPPLSVLNFEKIISYISKVGHFVDFGDTSNKKNKFIITFDDAFYDFYENAMPIIKKLDAYVTLNVIGSCSDNGVAHWTQKISCLAEVFVDNNIVPSCLSPNRYEFAEPLSQALYYLIKDEPINTIDEFILKLELELNENGFSVNYTRMLTWKELAQLIKEYPKLMIGNHTYNHQNLGLITDEKTLAYEIEYNSKRIEEELGVSTKRFAFPNRECNTHSIKYLIDEQIDIIQLTEVNYPIESENIFYRVQPYHSSFEENIFRIFGFHEKISNLVKRNR